MRQTLIKALGLLCFASSMISCRSINAQTVKEVGTKLSIEPIKNKYIEVYYDTITSKKLEGLYSFHFDYRNNYADLQSIYNQDNIKSISYFKKGIKNGIEKKYRNDTLVKISNYARGLLIGKQLELIKNDSIVSYYKQGIQEGTEVHYINGKAVRTTNYKNGLKEGEEKYFNQVGLQCASVNYSFTPFIHQSPLDGFEVSAELGKLLQTDLEKTQILVNGLSFSLNFIIVSHKYLGHIKIRQSGSENTDCKVYSKIDATNVVSQSTWVTLADQEIMKFYSGFFYSVDLLTGRGDNGVAEKWIILINDDSRIVQRIKIK